MAEYIEKLTGPLTTAALVVVFAIFILIERDSLREKFIRIVGMRRPNLTENVLDEAVTRINRYLAAQFTINVSFGAAVAIGVWLINRTVGHGGVQTALLDGVLCGLLRFIPYIGTWIGAIAPLGYAFAVFPGNIVFLATLVFYVTLELMVSQWIEPRVYGSSTGLSPLAVLVATVFWAKVWGPIGMLLSVPLTVLLLVIGKYYPGIGFLEVMLSESNGRKKRARAVKEA
jgi:predicted PurR-regulated permease PerM